MASFQDKLARSIYKMQNRLFDFNVGIQGTETLSVLLNIIVDKYGDREQTIEKSNPLHTIWDFVEDEIPTSMASSYDNDSTDNSQVIPFQITDCISKGNFSSGILWSQYTVSNNIGYDLNQNQEYQTIVEEFKNYDIW